MAAKNGGKAAKNGRQNGEEIRKTGLIIGYWFSKHSFLKEQHYRDRAFRALHRFDHHHGGGNGHRHPPSREERQNVGSENNVGGQQQQSNGVEYLKQIGHTLQQALLSFGKPYGMGNGYRIYLIWEID